MRKLSLLDHVIKFFGSGCEYIALKKSEDEWIQSYFEVCGESPVCRVDGHMACRAHSVQYGFKKGNGRKKS
ncbi:MAG: hypothetical protein GY795_27110 [Desulfobacterales bacterium]|nr:hypothetical protein [Desulfobacterales bacterium]